MSFLGPIPLSIFVYIAASAGVLAIGAYIIKMRRRRFEVPFSHLWKRVLEQKDANSLWKQLKRVLSLLFILAILGILLFAALDPTLGAIDRKARSVVILLDASASMKTMDGGGDEGSSQSRLDAAKAKAKHLIDSMGGGDVAMIMKVDGQATPMSRFSSDGPMLNKIVDGIEASDTPADLTRALGAAADALRDRKNPLIVLVSDGAYPEQQLGLVTWDGKAPAAAAAPGPGPGQGQAQGQGKKDPKSPGDWNTKNLATVDLTNLDVRYLPVGRKSENVGIVSFNVRRYIANKAAYEVYIEVQNFGAEPANRQLALYNGDTAVDINKIQLAPGQRIKKIYTKLPANADNRLRAVLRPGEGAGASDLFALDDQAFALLPARKKQKILLVTIDNLFLEGALLVYDNIDERKVRPDEYERNPAIADGFDVVIFDDYTPKTVPPSPASLLYFHPTGPDSPIAITREALAPHITEIDEGHPVMRWVSMSDVYMDKTLVFAPDARKSESTLAFAVRDPVIAAKRDGKRKILAFGFSLPSMGRDSATDLPLRVAFPMLLVNALDWFAGDQTDLLTTYATGSRERVPLDGVVGATQAEVKGPDGTLTQTPVIDGLATFYAAKVGYYDVAAKGVAGATIAQIELAANLASPGESDIAPSTELLLGGKKLEEPEAFAISRSRKLWTYLILLAMALIAMEWVTYHRRITV
ncbi:MAG TPA: VWA domain-containing protein [Kofleriaceae bacterium]|nr:VWA domain-containing protein [Kofleriaceae bacterium]